MLSCTAGCCRIKQDWLYTWSNTFFLRLDNTSIRSHTRYENYLVMIAGARGFILTSYSYIRFLFKIVGSIEKKPMRKSTDKVLKSYKSLTDFRSPRARPA